MNTTLRALFTAAAPGLRTCCLVVAAAVAVATSTGCAVSAEPPTLPEHVGVVTSGTFTVEDAADAGDTSPATGDGGAIELPSGDGGTVVVPSIDGGVATDPLGT